MRPSSFASLLSFYVESGDCLGFCMAAVKETCMVVTAVLISFGCIGNGGMAATNINVRTQTC